MLNSGRTTRISIQTVATALLVCCAYCSAQAAAEKFDPVNDATVVQNLDSQIPLDLRFRNEEGDVVPLGEFFNQGRPVIMSLNYSSCPMLCSLQLNGLVSCLRKMELNSGRDFDVVSVSMDPMEPPHRAKETRDKYLTLYGRGWSGWHFLVAPRQGRASNIEQLAEVLGITYGKVAGSSDYSHPAAFIITTPDGRISRYLTGVEFSPQTLRMSLVEASEGKIGSLADLFFLTCFHYDPKTGTYYPDAARMTMTVCGIGTVLLLGGLLASFWMKEAKQDFGGSDQAHATLSDTHSSAAVPS
ncbi:SCO family protein [Calycomorphotria hydatis]|uniref:Thioredoxin domain-containing protein n=1 Tax=Calycomorphotria hydatis TaxID=2528027 RepID=A0A517T8Z3_9PLAN|nr:SCO family protein [Calycomorphotria hydatis]QDT64836.1 hypothetical protein V22_20790 [Calycomorphotria hydatis]